MYEYLNVWLLCVLVVRIYPNNLFRVQCSLLDWTFPKYPKFRYVPSLDSKVIILWTPYYFAFVNKIEINFSKFLKNSSFCLSGFFAVQFWKIPAMPMVHNMDNNIENQHHETVPKNIKFTISQKNKKVNELFILEQ